MDVSTYTLLTQALHANSGQEVLEDILAQSTPGEEAIIFNQVPDGNGRQPLPANPLFGELVAGTPITPPAQVGKAAQALTSEKVGVPQLPADTDVAEV